MSANQSVSTTADRSREVRLGLVMYGGISLAIYIYGVAREFFDAVRGRGIFKLLKALTDSDIVVDVISGTSAGGINGILLAYCMANGLEFGEAASTWRDQGSIEALLRDPAHDMNPASVLRGDDYFLPELVQTFERLTKSPAAETTVPGGEDPSWLQEMDLFVTGTDVHGRVETRFDALGHPIDVKDHRVVFQLKHRAGRKEPLRTDDPLLFKALGKLARITSSFPAAFEPVEIRPEDPTDARPDRKPEDDRLLLWGWGPNGSERNVFLIDGGVLDNKPFTLTIREIFYRLSERPVERKLFYVEPDPERFPRPRHVAPPGILRVVWDSLSSIPGYESIADDLRMLDEHNEHVARFNEIADHYRELRPIVLDAESAAFVERVRSWEAGRPGPTEATDEQSVASEHPSPYAQCRLNALAERVVVGVLRVDGHDRQLSDLEQRAAAMLLAAFKRWPGSGDFTLYCFDADFRIRRLFQVLYTCPSPSPAQTEEENRRRHRARYALNRQLELLDLIRNAMERLLDEGEFHWQPDPGRQEAMERLAEEGVDALVAESDARRQARDQLLAEWADTLWRDEVAAAFLYLLNVGGGAEPLLPEPYEPSSIDLLDAEAWLNRDQLTGVYSALAKRVEHAKQFLKERRIAELRPSPKEFESVLLRTDQCERYLLERVGDVEARLLTEKGPSGTSLVSEYGTFIEIDALLCPLLGLCGLGERDIIDTVRISPLDAQGGFCDRPEAQKVSGDALYHFGGFFKKSWRSNDILWGRLDAVCQLTETLLSKEQVDTVLKDPAVRARLQAIDVAALFPSAPPPTIAALTQWIAALAGSAGQRASALRKTEFVAMRNLLIEAQQLEILREEIPAVIEDAIAEQMRWNQLRVRRPNGDGAAKVPGFDPSADAFFETGEGTLDALVGTVAAADLAQQTVERIRTAPTPTTGTRPKDTPLGDFFLHKYAVGSESLTKDVPLVVLLDLLSTALLVVRNCLVAVFADPAAVRRTALYRFVSLVLWSFDGMVSLLKRGASNVVAVLVALLLLAASALFVGINWWQPIVKSSDGLHVRWLMAMIVVPVVVLLGELWLLQQLALHRRVTGKDTLNTRNPANLIPPASAKRVLQVLFAAVVVIFIIQGYVSGWHLGMQRELVDSPSRIGELTQAGKESVWAGLWWDYAWIATWATWLSLASLRLARRLRAVNSTLWPVGIALAWLAWVAGAVDAVENAVLAWLLTRIEGPGCLGDVQGIALAVGRFCSHQKLTLPLFILLCLALGQVWLWIARRRGAGS